ncbi:MAG: lipid-A-disaccharide synthase [bacterium]|nr:lipid-A-disaccharide synthase [bacterium]
MKRIMIIAPDPSGDLYGANLAREIKRISDVEIIGAGGEFMKKEGVDIRLEVTGLSGIGVFEVFSKVLPVIRIYRGLKRLLEEVKPGCLVLIDSPELNIRIAKVGKRLGIPVVYWIPPQVFAWRRGRTKKVARIVDAVIPIIPNDFEIYREVSSNCFFFGHPLVDLVSTNLEREEACKRFGVDGNKKVIGLLPGSRVEEIESLLPSMLLAAEKIRSSFKDTQFIIPLAKTISASKVINLIKDRIPVSIISDNTYDVIKICSILIVTSGTATLEAAILGVPMVIVYKLHPLSFLLARLLVKVQWIGLPNIILKREVVPELIQKDANKDNMAETIIGLLNNQKRLERIKKDLGIVRNRLGKNGVIKKTAEKILQMTE